MLRPKEAVMHIPMKRVKYLLGGAKRQGVPLEELMTACDIPLDLLNDPEAVLEKHKFIELMLEAMRRTEDEFIGFGRGRVSKPGTFSMMAHAVINCATLEKALRRSIQFYQLFDYPVETKIEISDDEFSLQFEAKLVFDYSSFIQEASVFILLRFLSWLIGQQIVPKYMSFEGAAPKEDDEGLFFPCPAKFNQERTEVVMDRRYLDMPLVQNALSLSKFLKASLEELIDGNIQNASLNAQIRSIISKEYGNNFPDFSVICEKLNMTPQTLRRRLKEESTSYQEIKDSIRKDASIYYLSKPDLSIDEIALLMGFSEASSFHRAFKKWTGKTPSAYRQELLEKTERSFR